MTQSATVSRRIVLSLIAVLAASLTAIAQPNKTEIEKASGAKATVAGDVVRIGWSRDDVAVRVDGMPFPPAAGLGSWAAFKPAGKDDDAIVMGDTVVFRDEVDAAMDAAFAHGLAVTALHNHFFYDEPKVYFMHVGGAGPVTELAAGVKAVWDAIKQVRASNPQPADAFPGALPAQGGTIDAKTVEAITGLTASTNPGGVVKVSSGRSASMKGIPVDGSMGLTTWAAFTGSDALCVMDGDFIMSAEEVQPVLRALRKAGIHVVALHNHMIGEDPVYYFAHFWGKGPVDELAGSFKSALQVQTASQRGQ